MQVEEKRKMLDFEKTLNTEQARIWKIDTRCFADQEKEIGEKVLIQFKFRLNSLRI